MDNPLFYRDEIGRLHYRAPAYLRRIGRRAAAAAFRGGIAAVPALIGYSQTQGQTQSNPAMTPRRVRTWDIAMGEGRAVSKPVRSYVKKCMRRMIEKKVIVQANIVGNSGVPTTAGRVDPIRSFNILQGTADDDRTGNMITIQRVDMRILFTVPVDILETLFRVVIFQDSQTNGATPAVTDVVATGTGGMLAGYNADNVNRAGGKRFKILRDIVVPVNALGGSTTSSPTIAYRYVGLKGPFHIHYDATADAITDIVSGEIFVLTIAQTATGAVQVQQQIHFQDA